MSSVDATELLNFERKLAGLSREKLELEQRVQELTKELTHLRPLVGASGVPVNLLVEQVQQARAKYQETMDAMFEAVTALDKLIQAGKRDAAAVQSVLSNLVDNLECEWVRNAGQLPMSQSIFSLGHSVDAFLSEWTMRPTMHHKPSENAAQSASAD